MLWNQLTSVWVTEDWEIWPDSIDMSVNMILKGTTNTQKTAVNRSQYDTQQAHADEHLVAAKLAAQYHCMSSGEAKAAKQEEGPTPELV